MWNLIPWKSDLEEIKDYEPSDKLVIQEYDVFNLVDTFYHEFGHNIGLGHVCNNNRENPIMGSPDACVIPTNSVLIDKRSQVRFKKFFSFYEQKPFHSITPYD